MTECDDQRLGHETNVPSHEKSTEQQSSSECAPTQVTHPPNECLPESAHDAGQPIDELQRLVGIVQLRENNRSRQEDAIRKSGRIQAVLANHMKTLREVNEKLAIATLQTQAMSEEVEKASKQMMEAAHYDFLTGLPNRSLLEQRMAQAIVLAKRHGKKLAVLFIDLDRFKAVNDALGHAVGDALLQSVALRLRNSVRGSDIVSRQGGDEFVALITDVTDESAVAELADKMRKAVSVSYRLADHDLHIGVTLGISMYPADGTDADTLIRHADVAMYHTKKNGGNNYSFFKPEMNIQTIARQRLEADLFRALELQQFELYYQAQMDLTSGRLLGAEALIRWNHPTRGLLLPNDFLSVAEGCGAIIPLDRWALQQACRQVRHWLDAGLEFPVVSVNVSAHKFGADNFLEYLRSVLFKTQIEPRHLELELTESMLMKNAESAMSMLRELKAMGIKIAIDNFGTGYSSLSYLQRFPVDTLKIDRNFVAGITASSDNVVLIDSVINLGKSLGHQVIAEGIETAQQLDFLRRHDCAAGQGYYLSPAMSADEFSTLLKSEAAGDATVGFPQLNLPLL